LVPYTTLFRSWEALDKSPGPTPDLRTDAGRNSGQRPANSGQRRVLLSQQAALEQMLGDLNRIGGGAFSQVIGDYPKVQRPGLALVPADTTDEYFVAPLGVEQRHGILAFCRIILNDDTRHGRQQRTHLGKIELFFKLNIHRLGMATHNGNT